MKHLITIDWLSGYFTGISWNTEVFIEHSCLSCSIIDNVIISIVVIDQ